MDMETLQKERDQAIAWHDAYKQDYHKLQVALDAEIEAHKRTREQNAFDIAVMREHHEAEIAALKAKIAKKE